MASVECVDPASVKNEDFASTLITSIKHVDFLRELLDLGEITLLTIARAGRDNIYTICGILRHD